MLLGLGIALVHGEVEGVIEENPVQQNNFKNKPDDGFTAGLKFWLIFLIALVLMRFPLPYAIVFAFVGGMAGGFALGWWQELSLIPGQNGYSDVFVTMDAQRLLELDEPESDTYDRAEGVLRRRSQYVSNRPYDRDGRKQIVNGWLAWRRSSRPRYERDRRR